MHGVAAPFDIVAHHRERTRKAEARTEQLELLNAELVLLLARTLEIAVAHTTVDPCTLLAVIQDVYAPPRSAGSSESVASHSKSRRPTLLPKYGSASNRSDRRTA